MTVAEPRSYAEPSARTFGYAPLPGSYDEVFTSDGVPREHVGEALASIDALGIEELERRWDQARRLIRENGVTYNVYGDPRGTDRPWQLDPFPLLLDGSTWQGLSRGLSQRARLLDTLLLDLYGKQRVISQRLFPPELLFGNPGFLRSMHGHEPAGRSYLQLYAADIARAADGTFRVLGDRAQAPSGAGYALENRIVISRTLPVIFRDSRVQRLATFFRAMQRSLHALASHSRENPRIVLLTPGPYNETYFEHAYLARYLGFALVEGADLTVRERVVYMKTLGGLERVDVILRRLDDAFCDPLSLLRESALGIAGLVQAVRAKNVAVANALGSGVLETPAILPFLPALCRALLGEELALQSVPTYWCGQAEQRRYVLEHLETLVLKPTFWAPSAKEPVFGAALSRAERAELRAKIERHPVQWIAQEQHGLSTAPVLVKDELQPRHVSLRAYLTRDGDGFSVMPGGLVRVSPSRDSLVVSMQRGGGSKDLWVLGNEIVSQVSLLPAPGQAVSIARSGADLSSRVADNLFWLGRYMERAEGQVRLLRSLLARLTDDTSPGFSPEVPALVRAVEVALELEQRLPYDGSRQSLAPLESELFSLLFAEEPAHTLRALLASAHRLAHVVRDRISSDTFRVVSHLQQLLGDENRAGYRSLSETFALMNELVLAFAAFSGLTTENVTHGPGWRFSDLGRRIERAHCMTRLLRAIMAPACGDDTPTLEALLSIADSSITYRTRYLAALHYAPILDLLLTDESNPRSVAYQLVALSEHVEKLPRADRDPLRPEEARLTLRALTRVRLADVHALSKPGTDGSRPELEQLLLALEHEIPALAERLSQRYLVHAERSQSLGNLTQGA